MMRMIIIKAPTFTNDRGGEISMSTLSSPLPAFPPVPFLPPPPAPPFPSSQSSPSLVTTSSSVPLLSLCPPRLPLRLPLKSKYGPRECCKLPSRSGRSPTAKHCWWIFRLKFSAPFHFHNDTFLIFTVLFGVGLRAQTC